MAKLTRTYVERNWIASMGDGLDADHFREPPPGTRHAVCKPGARYCKVHEDQYNPHAGILETIGHLLFEWKGAPIIIGLGLGALLLSAAGNGQNQPRCPSCGGSIPFGLLTGFSYQCQSCKNWFSVT